MTQTKKVIDCDVHNNFKSESELLPYLEEPWKSLVAQFGTRISFTYGSPLGVQRKDAIPPNGGGPGSDQLFLKKQLIEPYNMEYVILNGEALIQISNLPDMDYASALASAYNNYLAEEWLSPNEKFKGSMLIASQDPQQAANEINRIGSHPDIVQVIMASAAPRPYGQRFYHPIYEAAEKNGLPVCIHPGGEGSGISNAPTSAGYPSNYLQWHTNLPQNFMAHLVSLVCDGVFEKYPNLRFVLCEGGVAWLPHLMWRMDKNFKALRAFSPWLKKMPSQYIRDHCYLTTQPVEEPENPKHLLSIFDMIDAENMLLYSSDYPHWDFDDPTKILKGLSAEAKNKILYQNAKNLYNL